LIAITFLSPFCDHLVVPLLRYSRYTGGMKDVLPTSRSEFDSPAMYRIGVLGRIPNDWCDRLEGMTITECSPGAKPPVTTLLGELSDQAALAGVPNTLYELHLPVLSVERLSADIAALAAFEA
jgi:hypothetical protein